MASIVKRNKSYAVVYYQTNIAGGSKKQKWETYHSPESAKKRKEELENPITFLGCAPHVNNLQEINIRFGLDDYYGGLHCGETFDVNIDDEWIPTRIEKASDWYLIGVKTKSLVGLIARK